MNKQAVFHMPQSQYAYALGSHSMMVRLRADKRDYLTVKLCYGDRVDPLNPIRIKEIPMEKKASDDLFTYYEAVISDEYTRICYYFLIQGEKEEFYYNERGLQTICPTNRTEFFQFPYLHKTDLIAPPAWAKDIVMYHIFPNSFASGKQEYHSHGTIRGILENVDYLVDLGITCIYLNPVFFANSYHKYDTIDYFFIDPSFGTKEEFSLLTSTCHEHGIAVILDGVFNHCGPDFFAFRDVRMKGKESEYYDWFYDMPPEVFFCDPPNYEAFAYVKEMPKLDTSNPKVEEYFLKVGTYWTKELDIDGWRLDVANEINHDFWRKFKKAVKEVKPNAFFIGEIWEDANVWLQGDQFDSTMNYRFRYLCEDFFGKRTLKPSEFHEQIQKMIYRYPHMVSLVQMNLLDSHDVPRFLSSCEGDRRRMELAFFYLFMSYGIPSVFYGDEMYVEGTTEPEYRAHMPWDRKEHCFQKFKEWIALRKKHSALRNGTYRSYKIDDDKNFYAFQREDEKECVLICINNGDEDYFLEEKKQNIPAMSGILLP